MSVLSTMKEKAWNTFAKSSLSIKSGFHDYFIAAYFLFLWVKDWIWTSSFPLCCCSDDICTPPVPPWPGVLGCSVCWGGKKLGGLYIGLEQSEHLNTLERLPLLQWKQNKDPCFWKIPYFIKFSRNVEWLNNDRTFLGIITEFVAQRFVSQ